MSFPKVKIRIFISWNMKKTTLLLLLTLGFSSCTSWESIDSWYNWAEQNNISSFELCDREFGASTWKEEDGCNRYVQEHHYSWEKNFGSYNCTEDCSWHQAWYDWAENKWIDSMEKCGWNSQSFIEWCYQYVDENY